MVGLWCLVKIPSGSPTKAAVPITARAMKTPHPAPALFCSGGEGLEVPAELVAAEVPDGTDRVGWVL